MNDPHVEMLTYRVVTTPGVRFDNPPPLEHETPDFRWRLEAENLVVTMKAHYPTKADARVIVEAQQRDWMIRSALDFDRVPMEFKFLDARVIDRNPPPKVPGQHNATGNVVFPPVTVSGRARVIPRPRKEYPKPPRDFRASPDVETMWFRYWQHLDGKESLLSMAYFCLTLIEESAGGRKSKRGVAARIYKIEKKVLDNLGAITATKGGHSEARKLDENSTGIPLSGDERRWVLHAVKLLIRRKGEYDHDPDSASSLSELTMDDLPPL